MAEQIRDSTSLRRWLEDKPAEWARWIALRSALRALPMIAADEANTKLHMTAFRALAVSWAALSVSGKFPALDIAGAAGAAARAVARTNAAPTAAYAARAAAYAARAVAADTAASAIDAAVDATADAAARAAVARTDVWGEIGRDVAMIERPGSSITALSLGSLWNDAEPAALEALRTTLFPAMLARDPKAWIWRDWYDLRRVGAGIGFPLPPKIDDRITLRLLNRPEAFWQRDPREVNAEIAGWIEEDGQERVDFFVSYATRDEPMAREIAALLDEAGYSSIVQFRDFAPGTNFVREMQRGLKESARVIALLSPAYEASEHCQAEWSAAYAEDPGGDKGKILPFLIAPTQLNPLARQIVYRSLVGLDASERRQAVYDAIWHERRRRSNLEVRHDAALMASPDVRARDAVLDAAPNPGTDLPLGRGELVDLVMTLREVVNVLLEELPGNAPKVVGNCLGRYGRHLAERRTQPILGLLDSMVSPVRREFQSTELALWGDGLADLFETLFKRHEELHGHFPRSDVRERFFAETPTDEAKAVGEALSAPVIEASEALGAVSEAGHTTSDFDDVVSGQRELAQDLASLPPSAEPLPDSISTPKRRFILSQIGFYERVLAIAAATATIAAVPAVQAAVPILERAIERLLALLL